MNIIYFHCRVGEIADESLHNMLDTTNQPQKHGKPEQRMNGVVNASFDARDGSVDRLPDVETGSANYVDLRGEANGIKRFVDPELQEHKHTGLERVPIFRTAAVCPYLCV